MQANFEHLSNLLSRVCVLFTQDDYVEWAFTGFDQNDLIDIILKNLPCRYVLPQYSTRTFEDWKQVTGACFRLAKALGVKYPPEFYRKVSFRGKITSHTYRDLVADFSVVMRSTFENKIREVVEKVQLPRFEEDSVPLDRNWGGTIIEERFQCSTRESNFEFHMGRLLARETILTKFAPMFQVCLSPKTWEALKSLNVEVECFASPLKVELPDYCSVFDEDKHFGSFGNFFNISLKQRSYVLHLPFSSVVAMKVKNKIRGSDAKFYIFLPFDIEVKVGFGELTPLTKGLPAGTFNLGEQRPHYSYLVAVINGTRTELDRIVESMR